MLPLFHCLCYYKTAHHCWFLLVLVGRQVQQEYDDYEVKTLRKQEVCLDQLDGLSTDQLRTYDLDSLKYGMTSLPQVSPVIWIIWSLNLQWGEGIQTFNYGINWDSLQYNKVCLTYFMLHWFWSEKRYFLEIFGILEKLFIIYLLFWNLLYIFLSKMYAPKYIFHPITHAGVT